MSTFRNGFCAVVYTGILLISLTTRTAQAQGLGNSPYSALGIGEVYGTNNIPNLGMGGLGTAYANSFFLNSVNPALLARNRNTIFEVGVLGQAKRISDAIGKNQQVFGANLSYLTLAFPVTTRWSAGIGLRPYSYVDYETSRNETLPGTTPNSSLGYNAAYVYQGRGGLNKATFTNGFHLGKNIYAGVEGALLFGNITTSSASQLFVGGSEDISVQRTNQFSYSHVLWRLGAAWRPKLNKDWFLNIGASVDPQAKLGGKGTETYQQLSGGGIPITAEDTIRKNVRHAVTLPTLFRGGIVLEKTQHFAAGFEVTYQPWSKINYISQIGQQTVLNDSYSVAAGIEFLPKVTSSNYLQLINYRLGVNYTRLPYTIGRDSKINDVSVSAGFSLPVGRFVNSLNLALIVGQRGLIPQEAQIRERYVKIGFGLSLNDRWFQRYKVD